MALRDRVAPAKLAAAIFNEVYAGESNGGDTCGGVEALLGVADSGEGKGGVVVVEGGGEV